MTRVKVECKSGRWPDSPHLSVSLSQEGKYFHRKPLAFQAEPCDMWHLSPLQTQENTFPRWFIPRCLAQEKVEVPSRWKSAPHSSFHFKKGIPSFLSLTVLGAFILTPSFESSHYFHLLACEFYLSVESLTVFSSDVFSHARNFYPRVFIWEGKQAKKKQIQLSALGSVSGTREISSWSRGRGEEPWFCTPLTGLMRTKAIAKYLNSSTWNLIIF